LDTERLRPFDLSPQQYNVLRILRGAKGKQMCMYEVLERMLDRSPNATRLTEKLIAKGLVERERSTEDRREVHLRITPKGRDLVSQVERQCDADFFAVARKLTEAEAAALNLGLDKLRT
jgi:DNA-binding MarR family transcriptional regulator